MNRFTATVRAVLLLSWLGLAAGCTPQPGSDETARGKHFLNAGKARADQGDYAAAQPLMEQALQADPGLVEAHHALAVLFDKQLNSPEKALYHYLRVLELQPDYRWADMITNRLTIVRMQLARAAAPIITSPLLDQEIDRLENRVAELTEEHQRAAAEIEELRRRLAACARMPEPANPDPGGVPEPPPGGGQTSRGGGGTPTPGTPTPSPTPSPTPTPTPSRYILYTVQPGDSLFRLGLKHGIHYREIIEANPGINERNFKSGTTIRIPVQ